MQRFLRIPELLMLHQTCRSVKCWQPKDNWVRFARVWNDVHMVSYIQTFLAFSEVQAVDCSLRLALETRDRIGAGRCACSECWNQRGLPCFLRDSHYGVHPFHLPEILRHSLSQFRVYESPEWTQDPLIMGMWRNSLARFMARHLSQGSHEAVRNHYRRVSGRPHLCVRSFCPTRIAVEMYNLLRLGMPSTPAFDSY